MATEAEKVVKMKVKGESSGVKEVTKDVKGATEALEDFQAGEKKASTASKALASATKAVGKASKSASNGMTKFVTSLKRIFLYRTVRKVLSEIAQAFKEGIGNVYQYSLALNNTDSTQASKNLDSLATSALYVANSLGATLTPVIQAITPIVYNMADAFARASNSVNQVLAALSGNSTFTYAKRFGTSFADSLSDASGSAKEIKRTLMGFDEINRLDAPDTSSGSGSSSALDYSSMFDEGVVSDKFKKIAEIIKTYVLPAVTAIGTAIGGWFLSNKLTDGISKVLTMTGKLSTDTISKIAPIASGILSIVAGLALIVYGVYDVINTGGSLKSWLAIIAGIVLVVTGVALAFGGIPALITGIVLAVGALGLYVATHWEQVKAKAHEIFEFIKEKLSELWQKILSIPIIGKIAEIYAKIVEIFVALGKAFYTYVLQPVISWLGKAASWVNQHVIQPILNFFKPIATSIGNVIGGIIKTVINSVFWLIESNINTFIRMLNGAIGIINKIPSVNISKVSLLSIPRLATGGFVGQGQLFVANEAGAEMVGSMNGHTAVANNQQIVEGIKQGVMQAMSQSNQNISLNVDGKALFDILVDRNNSMVRRTGHSKLLV